MHVGKPVLECVEIRRVRDRQYSLEEGQSWNILMRDVGLILWAQHASAAQLCYPVGLILKLQQGPVTGRSKGSRNTFAHGDT